MKRRVEGKGNPCVMCVEGVLLVQLWRPKTRDRGLFRNACGSGRQAGGQTRRTLWSWKLLSIQVSIQVTCGMDRSGAIDRIDYVFSEYTTTPTTEKRGMIRTYELEGGGLR
jgi:hypothetical protein